MDEAMKKLVLDKFYQAVEREGYWSCIAKEQPRNNMAQSNVLYYRGYEEACSDILSYLDVDVMVDKIKECFAAGEESAREEGRKTP